MKCLCPLSGMVWKAEGFETGSRKLSIPHPIFSSPLSSLVARETDWQAGRLSDEEKKLLFLAALFKSGMAIWTFPANPEIQIVEKNFLHLLRLTCWKESIRNPNLSLPKFSLSKGNSSLENFHYWLAAWESAKADWEAGISRQERLSLKGKLEFYLERRIKNVEMGVLGESQKYLKVLAAWAEIAADFPAFQIQHPISREQVPINEYWKEIICCPEGKILSYPVADIKEIEDHLIQEDNLEDLSTLYAGALVRRLRRLISRSTNLFGLELIELSDDEAGTGFSFQTGAFSKEKRRYEEREEMDEKAEETISRISSLAPKEEPKRSDYPTDAQFLRAKIAWKFSLRSGGNSGNSGN